MGAETVLFKSEERKGPGEVAAFLRQLADKVEQRAVILRQGNEELRLDLPDSLVLEVKAEEEQSGGGPKRSLEIEIEWILGGGKSSGVSLG
jgi:amphi-Trp domain-containing protein